MPIKKAIFPGESLPLITSDSKYFVRYRVVSSDGTLTSQWSGFYELEGNSVTDLLSSSQTQDTLSATVSADQNYILLQWEPIGGAVIKSSVFDVFAQWAYTGLEPSWSVDDYEYIATVASNNFSVKIPQSATWGSFVVQMATQDKLVTSATISSFGLGETSTDTVYDAPDFDGGEI